MATSQKPNPNVKRRLWTKAIGKPSVFRTSLQRQVTRSPCFPGVEQTRVHSLEQTSVIPDIFQKYSHNEIDTPRYYDQDSSEEYLRQLHWQKRGLAVDTKFYPAAGRNLSGDHDYGRTL